MSSKGFGRIVLHPINGELHCRCCQIRRFSRFAFPCLLMTLCISAIPPGWAQSNSPLPPLDSPQIPRRTSPILPPPIQPPQPPLPETPLPPLPAPEDLLPTPQSPQQPEAPPEVPDRVFVERFDIIGSTVFSPEELAEATQEYTGREISFAELLQARSAITQLYLDNGYITSGALIPPQTIENGVITIQVIEGRLEAINVTGTRRLNSGYVESRLAIAADPPLNQNRLLDGLRLLQLNPLIETISADLQAGTRLGTSVLQVEITEADSFSVDFGINNNRSPSVGSFRQQVQVNQANLTGLGDSLSVGYLHTEGSNEVIGSYTVPVSPYNATVQFSFGISGSDVIEEPFDILNIEGNSQYYELSFRQPLRQTPTDELAIGLTASHQRSRTTFQPPGAEEQPFTASLGSDEDGRTQTTAIRLFQEWTQRSSQHVLAGRSQFSLGIEAFDVREQEPESSFFAWRGQGQWVRLLAPDLLLLVRGDVQLTPDPLASVEQFSLGGAQSVRGYRQDQLLTDNGALFSTEVRVPIVRIPRINGVLQVAPFVDVGTGWNNQFADPDPSMLVGVGFGLLWRQGDRFSARLDWGIPLVDIDTEKNTWQENGIYFTVIYSAF